MSSDHTVFDLNACTAPVQITQVRDCLLGSRAVYLKTPADWKVDPSLLLSLSNSYFNLPSDYRKSIQGSCEALTIADEGIYSLEIPASGVSRLPRGFKGQFQQLCTDARVLASQLTSALFNKPVSSFWLGLEKNNGSVAPKDGTCILSYYLLAPRQSIRLPNGNVLKAIPGTILVTLNDASAQIHYEMPAGTVVLRNCVPRMVFKQTALEQTVLEQTTLKQTTASNPMTEGGLPEDTMRLVRLFRAIDGCLMFYYATSSLDFISVKELVRRVAQYSRLTLRLEDLLRIAAIFPEAYRIEPDPANALGHVLKGPMVMANLIKTRQDTFVRLCHQRKALPRAPLVEISANQNILKRSSSARTELMRKKPKVETSISLKSGSLLDRIRAKEAANKINPPDSAEQARQKYIAGQLEHVSAVLLNMITENCRGSSSFQSYPLTHITTKLSDSLNAKLSSSEAEGAIEALAAKIPSFCSIVAAGSMRAVKVYSRWNLGMVRQELHSSN